MAEPILIYPYEPAIEIEPDEAGIFHIPCYWPDIGDFPTANPVTASHPSRVNGKVFQIFHTSLDYNQRFFTRDMSPNGTLYQEIMHYSGNQFPRRLFDAMAPPMNYYDDFYRFSAGCGDLPPGWSFMQVAVQPSYTFLIGGESVTLTADFQPQERTLLKSGNGRQAILNPRIPGSIMYADLWPSNDKGAYSDFQEWMPANIQRLWIGSPPQSLKPPSIIPAVTAMGILGLMFLSGATSPAPARRRRTASNTPDYRTQFFQERAIPPIP